MMRERIMLARMMRERGFSGPIVEVGFTGSSKHTSKGRDYLNLIPNLSKHIESRVKFYCEMNKYPYTKKALSLGIQKRKWQDKQKDILGGFTQDIFLFTIKIGYIFFEEELHVIP